MQAPRKTRPPARVPLGPLAAGRALLRWWRYLPTAAKAPVWRVALAPLDALDRLRGAGRGLPPRWLRLLVGDSFEAVGSEYLDHFRRLAALRPDESVLDIGCGPGRIALPLTGYLVPPGRYEGFDIVPEAVRWCTEHICPTHPNFRFHLLDAANRRYRPRGRRSAAELDFPCSDASFDFAFATSVFTHLSPPECRHYLFEARRALRPGGRALLTFFLVADAGRGPTAAALAFRPSGPGTHTLRQRPGDTHFAAAYDESLVRRWLRDAGLDVVEPILPGTWRGGPGPGYQDIVLVRPGAPADVDPSAGYP